MIRFTSTRAASDWMDAACDRPAIGDRVHGWFSFLALDRAGKLERFTIGNGQIARAAEWKEQR